jgi:outer membrane protein assembly factor BamD (BamD/ComL family)
MKHLKNFLILIAATIIFQACENADSLQKKITQQEQQLAETSGQSVNLTLMNQLLDNYLKFSTDYPEHPKTPMYLYRATDLLMNTNRPDEAVVQLDKVMDNYPDFEKTPECLFLKGFILENQLGDLASARKSYQKFLKEYPEHAFADDVEMSLKFLGKSPEEMIKAFEAEKKPSNP